MPLFANSKTAVHLAINKDVNLVNAGTLNNLFSISIIYNFNMGRKGSKYSSAHNNMNVMKSTMLFSTQVGIKERPFPVITIVNFAVWI
jgi:hypothetical protein